MVRAARIIIPSLATLVVLAIAAVSASMVAPAKLSSSALRLEGTDPDKPVICSATHIGGGNILTANHCLLEGPLAVKTSKGPVPAEVLWGVETYDIALLHADGLEAESARIDCSLAQPGALVHAVGNPLGMASILTYGTVASDLITGEMNVDEHLVWKERIVADISVAPGESGGGLLDRANRIVGVIVGMVPPYRYAFVVPSSTVCRLLGR